MSLNISTIKPAILKANEVATIDYVDTQIANNVPTLDWQTEVQAVLNNNTTVIDGSHITTGTITANHISTSGLDAGIIKAGVMYNTGGTATTYTMKIDLDNGEIHIK